MQVKCDFCGAMIDDTETACPNCGAPNDRINRMVSGTPQTIAELEQWYKDRNLPPYETTRFFIGINYTGRRAFGIYKDGNEFVVYKNKDDGSRAVRYRGNDEAYAVNELYLKLKQEILNQKARNNTNRSYNTGGRISKSSSKGITLSLIVIMVFSVIAGMLGKSGSASYYKYNDDVYCYYDDHYYLYDDYSNDYVYTTNVPTQIINEKTAYQFDSSSDTWNSNYTFENSNYYENNIEPYQSSGSSDSDYDWGGSDSWDSGGSDWDSDW